MNKATLKRIVDEYGMEPLLDNEITCEQIGYFVMSECLIPELDELADAKLPSTPPFVNARRELLGNVYRYTVIVQRSMLL